jgi:hypothetical protein
LAQNALPKSARKSPVIDKSLAVTVTSQTEHDINPYVFENPSWK